MNDIEATDVLFAVSDNASTTHVTTTGDHNNVTRLEGYKVNNFSLLKVEFYCVVDFDCGIGIADGPTIVGYNVRNPFCAQGNPADFEEFVGRLLRSNAVNGKTTFDIVQEAEVLAGFFDGDGVHKASGVGRISTNFAVHLDQSLVDNCGDFASS